MNYFGRQFSPYKIILISRFSTFYFLTESTGRLFYEVAGEFVFALREYLVERMRKYLARTGDYTMGHTIAVARVYHSVNTFLLCADQEV